MSIAGKPHTSRTLLILFFWVLPLILSAQNPPYKFKRFTIEDGLSQSSVGAIFEDKYGLIWIATEDGVNRYDGVRFKIYRHNPADPNSLMNSWIGKFIEDKHGNLWMLPALGGVSRYVREKDNFRNYPLPGGKIAVDLAYDGKRNVIWFSTRDQVISFDPVKNRYKLCLPRNNALQTRLIIRNDTGWAVNATGLYRIDLDANKCIKIHTGLPELDTRVSGSYLSLDQDDKGKVYVGTDHAFYTYDPVVEKSRKYTSFKTMNNGILDFSILEGVHPINQRGKYIWFSTNSFGMIRLNEDDSTDILHFYNSPDVPRKYALSDNRIHYPSEGRDSIFLVTTDNGFNYYNPVLERFVWKFNDEVSKKNSKVDSYNFASVDRNGNYWLSTRLDGVSMIPKNKAFHDIFWFYERFIKDTEMPLSRYMENLRRIEETMYQLPVRDILEEAGGDLWICTDSKVVRFIKNSGDVQIFNPGTGAFTFPAKSPGDIIEDGKGTIWFLPFEGEPGRLNASKTKFDPFLEPEYSNNGSSFVYSGFFDRKGRLWIGQTGFITLFDPGTGKMSDFRDNPIFNNQSARFWYDSPDSILWIGAADKLIRHNYNSGTYTEVFLKYSGTSDKTIYPLMCQAVDSSGSFWIGTYGGGIVYYSAASGVMKNYRTVDGLSNDYILEVQFDREDNLWASTNDGLSKMDPKTGQIQRYNSGDGTVSKEFNAGASLLTKDGIILMGGTTGLTAFYPGQITENKTPPNVVFTRFTKFNKEVKLDPDIQVSKEIEVEYSDNLISFEFVALNFINPDSNRYAFKLEGFHDDWIQNGNKKEVYFTNLDPGNYTFKVKATNNDGVWSTKPAEISLTVLPPFYMTWWFRSIILLLAGTIIYALYQMRMNQIRAIDAVKIDQQQKALELEKRIKTEISRNLHDEVNTELTQLANVCRQLAKVDNISPGHKEELVGLNLLALKVRQLIDDVIWFIQPENSSDDRMVSKFTSTISTMLKYIDFDTDIDEDLFNIPGGVEINLKKQIYLIVKESLQNIIKHSKATSGRVSMKREQQTIRIEISDNGIGFDKSTRNGGTGLNNIRTRLNEIGGELDIETAPGKGTVLRIVINLEKLSDGR